MTFGRAAFDRLARAARVGAVLAVLGSTVLGMVACESTNSTKMGPDIEALRAKGTRDPALVGRWADGTTWMDLWPDGRFRWDEPEACAVVPCPFLTLSGAWTANGSVLSLVRDDGRGVHQLRYRLQRIPRHVVLTSGSGATWTLPARTQ